jgi:alkylated DNA repair dioxygenase AlkB
MLGRGEKAMIAGLKYLTEFITDTEENTLLASIDREPWSTDLKRRVQHYGYRYDYKARKIDRSMYLGSLPEWSQPLVSRLVDEQHAIVRPNQLIVNEYEAGQGITSHIDCVTCFGAVVCSLTLGSACVMQLESVDRDRIESLLLERGSLLVLAGESRYRWQHSIPSRKTDKIGDRILHRSRRVSLTFRATILDN